MAVRPAIKRVPDAGQSIRAWSTFTVARWISRKALPIMSAASMATSGSPVSSRRNCRRLGGCLSSIVAAAAVIAGCDSPPAGAQPTVTHYGDASPGMLPGHCAGTDVWARTGCVPEPEIKVNTVGYVPARTKLATVPGNAAASSFVVRNVTTEQVAYSGNLSQNAMDVIDTGDSVKLADFTDVTELGTYRVEVAGYASSPQFEIANSVYDDVLKRSLIGLYGQRCGSAITIEFGGNTFAHGICHQADAAFSSTFIAGRTGNQDATGGWHDAGDYGKYTVNGAFSVAFLIKAWEDFGQPLTGVDHIPDGSGDMPSILAEAKYQIDWLLKMQQSDGGVLHVVCPINYPSDTISPNNDHAQRYFLQASTAATAYFTAALAAAARAYRPIDAGFADELLNAAQLAKTWLEANPSTVSTADGTRDKPFVAGGPYDLYGASSQSAARTWADVELWRTTGDGDLAAIESAIANMSVAPSWDWAGAGNLAVFDYAASDSPARDAQILTKVQSAITTSADSLVSNGLSHGYGRAIAANDYNWGSNGTVARCTMNLWAAYRVTNDAKYLNAATQQLDYLFGRNPFGRSFVTGIGFAPPMNPHHRPSNADNVFDPWPGLLVGGPHKDGADPSAVALPDLPAGKFWFDEAGNYYVNEIAINWNAALIYALAGFVP
jgi:endoglucanase